MGGFLRYWQVWVLWTIKPNGPYSPLLHNTMKNNAIPCHTVPFKKAFIVRHDRSFLGCLYLKFMMCVPVLPSNVALYIHCFLFEMVPNNPMPAIFDMLSDYHVFHNCGESPGWTAYPACPWLHPQLSYLIYTDLKLNLISSYNFQDPSVCLSWKWCGLQHNQTMKWYRNPGAKLNLASKGRQ